MRMFLRGRYALACALALCLTASSVQAEQGLKQAVFTGNQGGVENAAFTGDDNSVELVGYNSSLGLNLGANTGCSCQVIAGADYLQLRATHSQQLAYVERNITNLGTNGEFIRYHQFDSDFTGSYRLWGGWRIPECGQEFRFTYSNFNGDGSFNSIPQVGTPGAGTVEISSPFEVVPAGDGDTLFGRSEVALQNYDFGCSKTIPLGCALGCTDCCDCCDDCCGDSCGDCCGDCCGDTCGCGCCCPAWDITFTGAVRVADISSELNYFNNITSTVLVNDRTAVSRVDFEGVGLRGGVQGRRYFGKTGMTSVFLKADISLLVGDLDYYAAGVDGTGANQFTPTFISCTHVIPVTELEAGGTVALTKCMNVSGGYLFSAWHDLGHRAEYNFTATTGGQTNSLDDANILAFDGWFLRLEGSF